MVKLTRGDDNAGNSACEFKKGAGGGCRGMYCHQGNFQMGNKTEEQFC